MPPKSVAKECPDCSDDSLCAACGNACEGEGCTALLCSDCAKTNTPLPTSCSKCERGLCEHTKAVGGADAGGFECSECNERVCVDCTDEETAHTDTPLCRDCAATGIAAPLPPRRTTSDASSTGAMGEGEDGFGDEPWEEERDGFDREDGF
jgi:hypothetical protein